jgi:hypothetical protein
METTTFDIVSKNMRIPRSTGVFESHGSDPGSDRRKRPTTAAEVTAATPKRRAHERGNPAHREIVEAGGGEYVAGMLGDLVLFNSKKTRSTLAIPANQLTIEEVARKLLVSDKAFGV